MTAAPTVLAIGDVAAERYELRGEARELPGCTAYRAFDREVEVEVALWRLRPELFPREIDRARFLQTARTIRGLQHANVRRLFHAAARADGLFVAVQLAAGDDLSRLLADGDPVEGAHGHVPGAAPGSGGIGGAQPRQRRATEAEKHAPACGPTKCRTIVRPPDGPPVDDAELLRWASGMCGALASAHRVGLVHGWLLPQDVVLVSGKVKVGGIGLWRHADPAAAHDLWRRHARYLAPEVREAGAIGARADVYGAARIIAELACGAAASDATDARQVADAIATVRPGLGAALGPALTDSPRGRCSSPAELLEALRAALAAGGGAIRGGRPDRGRNERAQRVRADEVPQDRAAAAEAAHGHVPGAAPGSGGIGGAEPRQRRATEAEKHAPACGPTKCRTIVRPPDGPPGTIDDWAVVAVTSVGGADEPAPDDLLDGDPELVAEPTVEPTLSLRPPGRPRPRAAAPGNAAAAAEAPRKTGPAAAMAAAAAGAGALADDDPARTLPLPAAGRDRGRFDRALPLRARPAAPLAAQDAGAALEAVSATEDSTGAEPASAPSDADSVPADVVPFIRISAPGAAQAARSPVPAHRSRLILAGAASALLAAALTWMALARLFAAQAPSAHVRPASPVEAARPAELAD
jgi:hypothetical protein